GPDAAVEAEQAVPALAIGVVEEQVEGGDDLQRVEMPGILDQGEVVLRELGGDEALEGADPERCVGANDRLGHDVPSQGAGELVGRSEEHTSELQSLAYLVC